MRPISGVFLLFIALVFSACGGSEAGNPLLPSGEGSMPTGEAILPATSAQRVLGAICSKLTHCFAASGALSEQSCRTAVLGTSSIDTELGLPAGYGTYQAIVDAERAGSIRPEAAATDACVSEIGALSCESPAVQSAYSSASPADYTNVEQFFSLSPSSCGGIYPGG